MFPALGPLPRREDRSHATASASRTEITDSAPQANSQGAVTSSRPRETDPTISPIGEEQDVLHQQSFQLSDPPGVAEQQSPVEPAPSETGSERRLRQAYTEYRAAKEAKKEKSFGSKVKRFFTQDRSTGIGKKIRRDSFSGRQPRKQGLLCEDCHRALCHRCYIAIGEALARVDKLVETGFPLSYYRTEQSRLQPREESSGADDTAQLKRSARRLGPSEFEAEQVDEENPFDEGKVCLSDDSDEEENGYPGSLKATSLDLAASQRSQAVQARPEEPESIALEEFLDLESQQIVPLLPSKSDEVESIALGEVLDIESQQVVPPPPTKVERCKTLLAKIWRGVLYVLTFLLRVFFCITSFYSYVGRDD